MPVLSPRTSHYSMQMTPRQPEVLLNEGHELATWEKCVEIGRVVSYFLGSVLFLIGSIYFYPEYSVLWDGDAGVFASWCYVAGCIMFFTGANLDFVQTIRYNHGTQLRQVVRAFNSLTNYMASSIFILGALYFLPTWYPKAPELGCWSFFVGCILFCAAAIVDLIFIAVTHEDTRATGFKIKNIVCWGTIAALGTFIGALFFILGSWYYLPRYINRVDDGTHYMNKAISFYVTGSVFFIINSLAIIPEVYGAVKATGRKNNVGSKV
ncbi:YrhK-like protein [Phytophthora infestans]|uniref:YrhK-like protein n=1 Tax=Phytophthora infestans TaxID=4787 RepID=A0A833S593_PHYIN|nr:YrhK-like protein [Phytophthora infestans]KAF4136027.1 YrhK-like protein [Phytophthora infestans]